MDTDREMLRLWNIVSEITEQLNQNREITARLQSHAGQLQDQAGKASDGASLRRFNTDISKEHFTSELERLSVALVMENQSLLHEHKQLNGLIQEYEQTLESVMNKFRGHSHAAQTHQLTLSRHYETLLSRERADEIPVDPGVDVEQLHSLVALIKRVIRSMAGKDPLREEQLDQEAEARGELEAREKLEGEEPWQGVVDWAEEREAEIQRLEKENAELRRALGITMEQERALGLEDTDQGPASALPSPSWDKASFPRPSSLRDDRSRSGSRLGVGQTSAVGVGVGVLQRRSGVPAFVRRNFGEVGSVPERAASPPNDVRWAREATSGVDPI